MNLLKLLKRLSSFVQTKKQSFITHDRYYKVVEDVGSQEHWGKIWNDPRNKLDGLLANNPQITVAVDIGAGVGWFSAKLSNLFNTVISIEPSLSARGRFDTKSIWITGFAEEELPKMKFNSPTLFLTGCVLSHLRDKEVLIICKSLNDAPKGSILCFNECWGVKWHQIMWHVRTQEWWRDSLPNWRLDFHGPEVQPNINMGIHAIKII